MRGLLVAASILLVSTRALAQAPVAAVTPEVGSDEGARMSEADARMLVSVSTGAALALGSLAVGGVVLATDASSAGRKAGAFTVLSGLTLSPIVSHAIAGEWTRALLFGAIPVASAAGAMIQIESAPVLQGHGVLIERRVLTLCFCLTLLSAAVGLYDSMHAAERAQHDAIAVAPWFERGSVGAWVGGSL